MDPIFKSSFKGKLTLSKLNIAKARQLAVLLKEGKISFAKLIGLERDLTAGHEAVLLEVEIELPQKRAYAIQRKEPVAVIFEPADKLMPVVLALRRGFPHTPHQNSREDEYPRELCLYETTYEELKLKWSPASYVERIRDWMRYTALNALHQPDQPLEQLLLNPQETVILPFDFLEQFKKDKFVKYVGARLDNAKKGVYLFAPAGKIAGAKVGHLAAIFVGKPQVHGIISHLPNNLIELSELCKKAGFDLIEDLANRLREYQASGKLGNISKLKLLFILVFPKTRTEGGPVESWERWAFACLEDIEKISLDLGVTAKGGGYSSVIINQSEHKIDKEALAKTWIGALRVVLTLSRNVAAAMNSTRKNEMGITLVGAGAIGSQVFNNLCRAAFGKWTIVDKDSLLPHNCARHLLSGDSIGFPKAQKLAEFWSSVYTDDEQPAAIVSDMLKPEDEMIAKLESALKEPKVIVDASASIPVARYLSRLDTQARRVSLFLNPNGTDSVLLCQDKAGKIPLTWLEMLYYQAVYSEKELHGHLTGKREQLRYARSCGDITAKIPNDLVCLHGAVLSRNLRNALNQRAAKIFVARTNRQLATTFHSVSIEPPKIEASTDWKIMYAPSLIRKARLLLTERRPNETGGVLIGSYDLDSKVVYAVDLLPSPDDSIEWPTLYIRGCKGLLKQIEAIDKATLSNIGYLGEWHTHPQGGADASTTDKKAIRTLSTELSGDGRPAIMMIVAQRSHRFYIEP